MPCCLRDHRACSNASRTRSVVMRGAARQPTILRLNEHWTSKTACAKTPSAKDNTMVGGVMPTWRSWTFDNAGSRTSQTIHALPGSTKPQETTTYSIGAPGHAHATTAETTTAGAAKTTTKYGYDIAGNTTAIEGPTGKKIIGWDAHGAVTSVLNGGKTTTYLRDIDGNIIIRRDPTGTSLYIGSSEVRDTNGTLTGLRTYNLAGQPVAQRTTTGGIYSMFTDQVGTGITAVSWNDLTKTTWRIEDPYGNQLGLLKGPWPTDRTYLDKSTDPATGLVQTGARLYNPNTGRFLSVDPILDATDALSLNGYSYSSGDPVNYSDPTGLSILDSIKHGLSKAKHALGSAGKAVKKYVTNPIGHAISKAAHFVGKVYRGVKNTVNEILRSPAKFIKNTTAGAVNWAYQNFKKLSKGVALADDLAHDRVAVVPGRGIVTSPSSSTAAVNHFFGKLDQHQRTAETRAGIDRTSNAYRHVGPFIAESIAIAVVTRGAGTAVSGGSRAGLTFSGESRVGSAAAESLAAKTARGASLRPSGSVLEHVNDVMKNPRLLQGVQPMQMESLMRDTPSWQFGALTCGRSAGSGWTAREINASGTDFTGRYIQWSPGSPRHFGGAPYWKVSSGDLGTVRFPQ
ncbi:RHS repeat-associated core domain-containing protein [Luteococcus sp.]|uniref:RHS repeat-associated core domain-containing protein n=1 Tax=Luteococcus sp. TaxID=1969402 RepID=UPI0034620583